MYLTWREDRYLSIVFIKDMFNRFGIRGILTVVVAVAMVEVVVVAVAVAWQW